MTCTVQIRNEKNESCNAVTFDENPDNAIISFNDVSFNLGKLRLEHITFTIPSGYFIGLTGKNGAGKTTLMRMIMGKYPNYSGYITVDGYDLRTDLRSALQAVAYISEKCPFFMELTPEQNEDLYQMWYESWNHVLYMQLLNRFQINLAAPLKHLSKGNFIKFQVAFALAHHPRVLLLDEPTAGLDPVFRRQFLKLLQDVICMENCSVVLATHLNTDLEKIADYNIEINGNNINWNEVGA